MLVKNLLEKYKSSEIRLRLIEDKNEKDMGFYVKREAIEDYGDGYEVDAFDVSLCRGFLTGIVVYCHKVKEEDTCW